MSGTKFHPRFFDIQNLIAEVSKGNFSFRIGINREQQDVPETVVALLNMMTQELEDLFYRIDPTQTKEYLLVLNFVLDSDGKIRTCNYRQDLLGNLWEKDLTGTDFLELLSERSKDIFKEERTRLLKNDAGMSGPLQLEIKNSKKLQLSITAHLQLLHNINSGRNYLLTAFQTVRRNEQLERYLKEKASQASSRAFKLGRNGVLRLESDRRMIKEIHQFVLKNIHQKLPSLSELAAEKHTNISKIKIGFKHMYGTTIHQFHLEKRLLHALNLIQHTQLPIQNIAESCGFTNASHFSRKFKKRFGYRPSDLRS